MQFAAAAAQMTARVIKVALIGCALAGTPVSAAASFPFLIQGDRFLRDGLPVFLQIIDYQPLEPGQAIDGEIREARVQDDLKRFRLLQGGSDPIVLRVYAQPTAKFPVRMPKSFYDGVRALGFWIIRDIYFDPNYQASGAVERGKANIDAIINEVAAVGAFDRIFAWELGNEFRADSTEARFALENFVCAMRGHLRLRMSAAGREQFTKWVTWGSFARNDPLRTSDNPVLPNCLDFISYNLYSYDPEHLREHQAGPNTGTPFEGYLAALKDRYPNIPLVISECGLPDNATPGLGQGTLSPLYPSYRYGGLSPDQIAEALADRYWDARLSGRIAGIACFEWNDEWHKAGDPTKQADDPEEHFGLARFAGRPLEARFKLQFETIRDLFTLRFDANSSPAGLEAEQQVLSSAGSTFIRATIPPEFTAPIRFRWEASRGHIVGDSDTVRFFAGGRALGPALVTAVAIDAKSRAWTSRLPLQIQTNGPPTIEVLTLGAGDNTVARASGRVSNVDLTRFKVAVYIQTDRNYVQPFTDMKSIWVGPDGYWWTPVDNRFKGKLISWLVPIASDPPLTLSIGSSPSGPIATATRSAANDLDNELLPDSWEASLAQGRYDDADGDGANNLEEFFAGTSPTKPDNDNDADGLPDNWERRFFGSLVFSAQDDPDGDGLENAREFQLGTHPGRTAVDRDRDGLPDAWELRWFKTLLQTATEDSDGNGRSNLDAYELGFSPIEALPGLSIRRQTNVAVVVAWPVAAQNLQIETSTNPAMTQGWIVLTNTPVRSDNELSIQLPISGNRFFRLRKP